MIVLALLVWLPIPALAPCERGRDRAATTLLDGIDARQFGAAAPLWYLFHQLGVSSRSPATSS
jgi:hypothetical protein